MSSSLALSIVGGAVLRVGLLAWGQYQDATSSLRFEDVDYSVFTDAARILVTGCPLEAALKIGTEDALTLADPYGPDLPCARGYIPVLARFVLQFDPRAGAFNEQPSDMGWKIAIGIYSAATRPARWLATLGDPYARETYRYTPFLAGMLSPIYATSWIPRDFGKYIFLLCDLGCGILMWYLVQGRKSRVSQMTALRMVSILWFLNPIPAQIAARGSSESVVGLLILLFLYFFLQSNPELPPEGLKSIQDQMDAANGGQVRPICEAAQDIPDWTLTGMAAPILLATAAHFKIYPLIYAAPVAAHLYISSGKRVLPIVRYAFVGGTTFLGLNLLAYGIWGSPYLEHSWLYHLSRQDHRHNFSAYFLPTYLSTVAAPSGEIGGDELSRVLAPWLLNLLQSPLTSFIPQLALVAYVGFSLGAKDIVAAFFAQTFIFVHWNKVITSQYFTWYLWLLPILLPTLAFRSTASGAATLFVWVASQALWLSQAYLLELKAQDTFLSTWAASIAFLASQTWVLVALLDAWSNARIDYAETRSLAAAVARVKQLKSAK